MEFFAGFFVGWFTLSLVVIYWEAFPEDALKH